MRNLRSILALTVLVGALAVPLLATGQPAGQRRIQVDSSPVPSPDFQDGGDINFTATGSTIIGDVKSGSVAASEVTSERISGSTYSTVQDMQTIFHSSGVTTGGGITDDTDGTISVAAGTGLIRSTNSATATLYWTDWAAESGANVALTDADMNYVYVEYNAGTPRVIATITERTDLYTNILLGTVYRSGTTLHITENTRAIVGDHALQMILRMNATMPFQRESGAALGETGTRNITISVGTFWEGLTRFNAPSSTFDSSAAGTFTYYYRNGAGGWYTQADSGGNLNQTQITNAYYDNNTGTLAALSNNKFGNSWVYMGEDGDVYVVLGRSDHSLASAQEAGPPATVPPWFDESHVRLIGKIIVQQGQSVFTEVVSAFDTALSATSAADHGDLLGLSDNDHPQYVLSVNSTPVAAGDLPANLANTGDITFTNASGDITGTLNTLSSLAISSGAASTSRLTVTNSFDDASLGTPAVASFTSSATNTDSGEVVRITANDASVKGLNIVVPDGATAVTSNGKVAIQDAGSSASLLQVISDYDNASLALGAVAAFASSATNTDSGAAVYIGTTDADVTGLYIDGPAATAVALLTDGTIQSTVATANPPFVVASTTKVTNLNVDWLDGVTFGTMTDGMLCTYTSSGTVVNCNTSSSAGEFTDEGTVLRPGDALDDWIRVSGDATAPRIGSTDATTTMFDTDNDGASEATIDSSGNATFNTVATADQEAADEGNYLFVPDDDNATGTAFDGTTGMLTLGDIDETASDNYCFYLDTTQKFCIGSTIVTTADWDFGGGGIEIENGSGAPGNCTPGQLFLDSAASSGQRLKACESTDTWVVQGDGGGTPTLNQVTDPSGDKTFSMGTNQLVWSYTTPNDTNGAFQVYSNGAWTGALMGLKQDTGNPAGGTDMLLIDVTDQDPNYIRTISRHSSTNNFPMINEFRKGIAVATGDKISPIKVRMNDGAPAVIDIGTLRWEYTDVTTATEDAKIVFQALTAGNHDTLTDVLTIDAAGVTLIASPAADDSDFSAATTAYVQGEINGAGGAGIACSSGSCATASGETNFLASGALTCTTAQQGRMQVHTTPLQYCDNAATPALQYAAYGTSAGAATSVNTADTGGDATTWPLIGGTSTGAQSIGTDGELTYDASSNTLVTGTFSGALSGGANSVANTQAASDDDTSLATTAFTHAVVDALDGNGITCTSGGSQTCSVDADIRTRVATFNIENLQTTTDDYKFNIEIPNASTITQVTCSTSANTATIKLDERSNPNSAGVTILGSTGGCSGTNEIACSTTKNTCTTISNAGITAGNVIAIAASADTLGSTDVVRVHVTYTIDD